MNPVYSPVQPGAPYGNPKNMAYTGEGCEKGSHFEKWWLGMLPHNLLNDFWYAAPAKALVKPGNWQKDMSRVW